MMAQSTAVMCMKSESNGPWKKPGDPPIHPINAGLQGLRLKSFGASLTNGSSLMRLGLEQLLTLDLHCVIHERGEG
jgi:hypothetical protein